MEVIKLKTRAWVTLIFEGNHQKPVDVTLENERGVWKLSIDKLVTWYQVDIFPPQEEAYSAPGCCIYNITEIMTEARSIMHPNSIKFIKGMV